MFSSISTSHYGFNFEQKVFFDQPIDDEQGVGGVGLFAVYFRKVSRPQFHELFNVLRMDEIGRELYNILEIGVYPLQYSVKVIEDLAELALKIVSARDFAVFINGELPGVKIQRPLIHSSSMRIKPLRRTGVFRIYVRDALGHWFSLQVFWLKGC